MQSNTVVEHHKSSIKFLYKTSNKIKYLQQSSNCDKSLQKNKVKKSTTHFCVMPKLLYFKKGQKSYDVWFPDRKASITIAIFINIKQKCSEIDIASIALTRLSYFLFGP